MATGTAKMVWAMLNGCDCAWFMVSNVEVTGLRGFCAGPVDCRVGHLWNPELVLVNLHLNKLDMFVAPGF